MYVHVCVIDAVSEQMYAKSVLECTERYSRTPGVHPDEDIHKICFFIFDGKIRVDYHREPGGYVLIV